MPVLDAKALKSDRKGLAFLKAVLRNRSTDKADPVKSEPHPQMRRSNPARPELNR
jgi:hypothetical protein